MKELKDLNLLDRFLFSEAMEDPENMRAVLEIILGKETVLKHLPQTEKETRTSPFYRFAKLDVWAQDVEDVIYDTEVQKKNTGNLPKRSRYYEGLIDSKLLEPGAMDFNLLNDVFIIIIAPFDLFGLGKYMYTFKMTCQEDPSILLNDGATRIFLNTHGTNPEEVSPELIELLRYMENTTQETADQCRSYRIQEIQKRVASIKSSEKVSVKYMQEWEERALERQEAFEQGHSEGFSEGHTEGFTEGHTEGFSKGHSNGVALGMEQTCFLFQRLQQDNRLSDLEQAIHDKEYLSQLLQEYGIR